MKEAIQEAGGKVTLQESKSSLVNRIKYGDKVSSGGFTMRHDILVEFEDKVFILDTKYKEMPRFEDNEDYDEIVRKEADQLDLYQVVTYASKAGLNDVYLLYPMYRREENEKIFPVAESDYDIFGVTINIHFIRMPFIFETEDEEKTRQQLIDVIKSLFSINE